VNGKECRWNVVGSNKKVKKIQKKINFSDFRIGGEILSLHFKVLLLLLHSHHSSRTPQLHHHHYYTTKYHWRK
jgi:hypothetical protein